MEMEDLDLMGDWLGEVEVGGKAPPKFLDENADDLVGLPGSWLVKGLWPRVGVCFVAGQSGSGKSFWVIQQISQIALGRQVLGRRTVKSGVVYIAAEGANGVRTRFEALRKQVGRWDGAIRFIPDAPNLVEAKDMATLRQSLKGIKRCMEDRGQRLGAVVVDTLAASAAGADENSSKEMGPVLKGLQGLAAELEVCVIVVAHHGKDAERGIRGWSGLHANADGVIFVLRQPDEVIRTGYIAKVKDGEAGEKFAFALQVVELGMDDDGDPITSCVVEDREPPAALKATRAGPGAPELMILSVFDRMSDQFVEVPLAPGVRAGAKGVSLDDLRAQVFEAGFHSEVGPALDEEPLIVKRWKEARKKAFQRAMHKLHELGRLRHEGGFVWAP